MHSMKIVPVAAAIGAQLVAAQRNSDCPSSTLTISEAAQATLSCTTIEEDVVVHENYTGALDISGPITIKGDLIVKNANSLNSIGSTSLRAIEGTFDLNGAESLSRVTFSDLTTLGGVKWLHANALDTVEFGVAGVTKVKTVEISDTTIQNLDAFKLSSVDQLVINNNRRLQSYDSTLHNVSQALRINNNGAELNLTFSDLVWANHITIGNARAVSFPALVRVNESIYMDQNTFERFAAPNLTETGDGAVSFTNNTRLTNISMPLLEKIGGDLTIVKNIRLNEIDGFPELGQVGGAVLFGGNFTDVSLPKINDVKGTFDLVSTEDITDSCATFKELKDSGDLQGPYFCDGENSDANEANSTEDGGNGRGNGNGGSGNGDSDGDEEDAASLLRSSAALATIAGIVGAAQFLL